MAGVYLHIPFCKQACNYCNFYFLQGTNKKNDFLKALHTEIGLQADFLKEKKVNSVYFGGGTPSVLTATEIEQILISLNNHFTLSDEIECTLEANPDDLSSDYLESIRLAGINRLSIGVQSLIDTELTFMNRAHTVKDAVNSLSHATNAGFENISADLIYGIPKGSIKNVKQTIDHFLDASVKHISAYALTVEPRTKLEQLIKQAKVLAPDEAHQLKQFNFISEYLKTNGFEHYEISNFGKKGFRSLHNSNYWNGVEYLGLGPSAHSYKQNKRLWNPKSLKIYCEKLSEEKLAIETESLTKEDLYNEMVMISLRLEEGLNLETLSANFGYEMLAHMKNELINIPKDYYILGDHRLKLTSAGRFKADGIASQLFMV